MKKVFKVLTIVFLVVLSVGCAKKIDKLSYTQYNEYFSNKEGYTIMDNTSNYDIDIRRYLEASEGNIQIFYIEFDNETSVDNYLKDYFENDKNNKVKKYKNYTYIKSTKNRYMKLYKKDNVIVYANTNNKKYRHLVNKTLKELGY